MGCRLDHCFFELKISKAWIGEPGFQIDPGRGKEKLSGKDIAEVFDRFVTGQRYPSGVDRRGYDFGSSVMMRSIFS